MSQCIKIRLRSRPNFTTCDKYSIASEAFGAIEYVSCGDEIKSFNISPDTQLTLCVLSGTVPTFTSTIGTNITIEYIGECSSEDSTILGDDLYFDTFPNFDLRETKQLTELTETDTLKFNYSIGFDLPPTNHNLNLLKTFFNPNVLDNEYNEVEVEVIIGSHVITESELYVRQCNSSAIGVELRLAVDHWARCAKDLKLCTLPYATVPMGCDHIKDVVENQYIYDSTNNNFNDQSHLGIRYPYADYGRLIQDPTDVGNGLPFNSRSNHWIVPVEMMRPWFYVTGLLKRGFCAKGWEFKSPLFESEFGRRLVTYIFNRNYGIDDIQKLDEITVRAEVSAGYSMGFQYSFGKNGSVVWDNINYDPIGSIDPITGLYSASGEVKVKGKIIFTMPNSSDTTIKMYLGKPWINNGPTASGGQGFGLTEVYAEAEWDGISDEVEWEFEAEGISMTNIEELGIWVFKEDAGEFLNIQEGSFIDIQACRVYHKEGDDVDINDFIDCEYTFLDLIKGLAHTFNLKFKTDFANRCVEMYAPYDADFWGDSIEGFFIEETIEDISQKLNQKSKKVTTPKLETSRYHKLCFKDTNDRYIEELDLSKDLWSRVIDLGEKFTVEETTEICNPFFEPTANRVSGFGRDISIHMPAMWGQGEFSFSQGPRIAIDFGYVSQDYGKPWLRMCSWDDDSVQAIPTVSQYVFRELSEHNNFSSPVSLHEENLIYAKNDEFYGYAPEKTLYHLVYKRWLLEQLNNLTIEYLVDLSKADFLNIDFRKYVCFYHLGRLVVARMNRVNDFHFCTKIQTPIEFIPQRQLSDLCDLLPDNNGEGDDDNTPAECRNQPILNCDRQDNCWLFTIGGNNNAPIVNTLFEVSYDNGTTWAPIPNLTTISAQLCDPTGDFILRATVSYDAVDEVQCPDITLPNKPVIICPDLNLEMYCTEGYIRVGSTGQLLCVSAGILFPNSNYNVTVISGTVDSDGAGPIAHLFEMNSTNRRLVAERVCSGQLHVFEVTFQVDDCPPQTLSITCDRSQESPAPPDCSNVSLELSCVKDDNDCWTFDRNASWPAVEVDEYIKYRCSEDAGVTWGPWKLWDEETPVCCGTVQARWFMHFCEGECPMKCSDIVTCGDCDPIENLILCNQCTLFIDNYNSITYPDWSFEWFELDDLTDPTIVPTLTALDIGSNYMSVGTDFFYDADEEDAYWYAVIISRDNCNDVVLFFYHKPPLAGEENTDVTDV